MLSHLKMYEIIIPPQDLDCPWPCSQSPGQDGDPRPSLEVPQLDWLAAYFGESLEPETGVTREGCQETTMKPKSEMSICIEMVE